MEEERVWKRLKAGDDSVLSEVDRWYGGLVAAALTKAYGIQYDDSSSIFNCALYELWEKRNTYDPKRAPIRAFLFMIANRRAIDFIRKGNREQRRLPVSHLHDWSAVPARTEPQPEKVRNKSLQKEDEAILLVFDSLPRGYKEVLKLDAVAEGIASSSFVSEVTGIPRSQVPVYRQRAKEMFRDNCAVLNSSSGYNSKTKQPV